MRGRDTAAHAACLLVVLTVAPTALIACSTTATGGSTTVATSTPVVSPEAFRCATTLEALVFDYLNGAHDRATFTDRFGAASALVQPLVQAASATADERTEHGMAAGLRVTQYAVGQLCSRPATLAEVLRQPPVPGEYDAP